eukprot:1137424-Pelagomonas_calceolata.AAC.2
MPIVCSYEPLLRLSPESYVAALEAKGEDLALAALETTEELALTGIYPSWQACFANYVREAKPGIKKESSAYDFPQFKPQSLCDNRWLALLPVLQRSRQRPRSIHRS